VSSFLPSGEQIETARFEGDWEPSSRLFRRGGDVCFAAWHHEGSYENRYLISLAGSHSSPAVTRVAPVSDDDLPIGGPPVSTMRQALVAIGMKLPPISTIWEGRAHGIPNSGFFVKTFPVVVGEADWPAVAFSPSLRSLAIADGQLVVGGFRGDTWHRVDIAAQLRSAVGVPQGPALSGYGVSTSDAVAVFGIRDAARRHSYYTVVVEVSGATPRVARVVRAVYASPMPGHH
jgi:hypothetical protein